MEVSPTFAAPSARRLRERGASGWPRRTPLHASEAVTSRSQPWGAQIAYTKAIDFVAYKGSISTGCRVSTSAAGTSSAV